MNDLEIRQPSEDDLLDRLVDGELGEAERRALLEDFERRSDGWRKCALAFLEAQTFGAVFREHVTAPAEPVAAAPSVIPLVAPRKSGVEWPRFLAAAASFLIACTAIMWYRGTASRPETMALPGSINAMPAVAHSPSSASPTNEMLALTMVGDKPGTQQTVQLPLVRARSVDEAMRQAQNVLPPEVVRQLQQHGQVVQQQQQLIPVDLQDGRRALVPVNQVELRYVGNHEFQ